MSLTDDDGGDGGGDGMVMLLMFRRGRVWVYGRGGVSGVSQCLCQHCGQLPVSLRWRLWTQQLQRPMYRSVRTEINTGVVSDRRWWDKTGLWPNNRSWSWSCRFCVVLWNTVLSRSSSKWSRRTQQLFKYYL